MKNSKAAEQININFMTKRLASMLTILFLTVLLFGKAYAQKENTVSFFDQMKNYDLSTLLTANSFLAEDKENSKDKIQRAEILGFIGDDYQRLYIHFISAIQNPTNPYEYLVYGKTMVKETVCSFQGTITIKEARIYKSGDVFAYKQGFTICEVMLFEDKKQSFTGLLKGKLTSNFIIDDKKQFRYNGLMFVADRFSNNQFVGTWTSYKTNASKKCNWGDYRIPECGDLDIGAGEFSVNEKYVKNGWLSYMLENMVLNESIVRPTIGKKDENKKWWE